MTEARQKILDSLSDPYVHWTIEFCDRYKVLAEIPLTMTKAQKKQFDKWWREAGSDRRAMAKMPKFVKKAFLATGRFFEA